MPTLERPSTSHVSLDVCSNTHDGPGGCRETAHSDDAATRTVMTVKTLMDPNRLSAGPSATCACASPSIMESGPSGTTTSLCVFSWKYR